MKALLKKIFFLIPILLMTHQSMAQSGVDIDDKTKFYIISAFVIVIALLAFVLCLVILRLLRFLMNEQAQKLAEERGEVYVAEPSWWNKLITKANDAVPIEREGEILLDHNYDGIRELDNHLPPWWKWMFYLSIVFAFVYMGAYHLFDTMPLQEEEYNTELAEAEAQKAALLANAPEAVIDESNVEMLTDAGALSKGKSTFESSCATCHKSSGAGAAGPNLTDDYWLHGGSMTDVYRTIKVGVPEKGMVSWEPFLSPAQMQQVASYVMSLHGTNPPDGKKPQGELYVPQVEPVEMDSLSQDASDSLKVAQVTEETN